ncbi:hypothetical protein IW261DRAFT_861420 [Armillaria novae-zelandiae]|uniref:BTB domain-containing protein n=1 Tax=Armillaria novae-zelandiae TaxID=153914 RepID=A0AA39UD49_9AGAR|nr:hypothetical protein IW261DRAFT_861420 [Armillaria novae-zelandiae]
MNEKDSDKMTANDHKIENLWIEAFGSVNPDHNPDAPSSGVKGIPPTSSPPTSRNRRFYFDDDMTTFIVENELFRIHSYFLTRESEFFRTMLSCPPGSEGPEGMSDDKPIPIGAGATREEFECVLDYAFNQRGYNVSHQTHHWINILTFCNRFDLDNVRGVAMSHLGQYPSSNPIDAIAIAERVDMKEWLLPAFKTLCQRVEPLNLSEGNKIGMEKALLIARAREAVRDRAEPLSPLHSGPPTPILAPEPYVPAGFGWTPGRPPLYSDRLVTRVVEEVLGNNLSV